MSFIDFDCGIAQLHKHTGIMHEAYYIQYWCTRDEGWVDRAGPDKYGTMPTRCRTQSTSTEEIELYGEWSNPLADIMLEELEKKIEKDTVNIIMEE